MENIELINKVNSNAMLGAHLQSGAVLRGMLNREIQSVIGYRSAISVSCDDGIVTLNGYFANRNDKNNALHKAIANPSVRKVVNNASSITHMQSLASIY